MTLKSIISKFWFPVVVAGATMTGLKGPVHMDESLLAWNPETSRDTVIYDVPGYKRGWTQAELDDIANLDSALLSESETDTLGAERDTTPVIHARDTMKVPDSLKYTNPFRYKYYVALRDSFTHVFVRDSLKAAGDSIDWPMLDSLYAADSIAAARAAFEKWYNSLSPKERKAYDKAQIRKAKDHQRDSVKAIRDSASAARKAHRDSVRTNTPRILGRGGFAPDSLLYTRYFSWTHDRDFHDFIGMGVPDTTANYHFHDFQFQREDIGGTWLGTTGSPVLTNSFFKRTSTEDVSFYEPYESWSFSAQTLPMYNTKTPYTELGYTGTLLANDDKEADNVHILTTTNITPELNVAAGFDIHSANGILDNEATSNKTVWASTNYLGKKYLMHAGAIANTITHGENGGITDNYWIRDTTVDGRDISIALSDASSTLKKRTLFLDQQYKIPFTFLRDWMDKREEAKWEKAYCDSIALEGEDVDTTALEDYLDKKFYAREDARYASGTDVTTAFVGHSSEYSKYTRAYTDNITSTDESAFYGNVFNYNPTESHDSMSVTRLDNKLFIRLQPWASDALISKIDIGVGDRFQKFYVPDQSYMRKVSDARWNSAYIYAGASGQIKENLHWDAKGNYVFAGTELNDLDVQANAIISLHPFRRHKNSPMNFGIHFSTTLKEPGYYEQHLYTNHFKWDCDFSKISTTKIHGSFSVPQWKLKATAGYALIANSVYYDSLKTIAQSSSPVSVISGSLQKDIKVWLLHFDNRVMVQYSSNQDVLPLPLVSLNLRYYIQIPVKKGIMDMQIGVDGWYNTKWYTPGWNPNIGVFYNQHEDTYNNGPYFDLFANIQWKKCCIFVKYENAGQGIIGDHDDYFSAHHYINTTKGVKFGIFWPFYTLPGVGKDKGSGKTSGNK